MSFLQFLHNDFLGMLYAILADMPFLPAIRIFTSSRLFPQKEQCKFVCFAIINAAI
jgi:hypothetical protein